MTEVMTLQNIFVGGVAVFIVRAVVWKYWAAPRRLNQMRKLLREEISLNERLKAGVG